MSISSVDFSGADASLEQTEEVRMQALTVINLVVAAYFVGRIHQFVRDARSVLGLDKNDEK